MTTLKDVTDLLESKPTVEQAYESGIVNNYLTLIMKAGRESLMALSDEEKVAAISILQSYAVTDGVESGILTQRDLDFLVSDRFGGIVATIFRASVGIANMEELI